MPDNGNNNHNTRDQSKVGAAMDFILGGGYKFIRDNADIAEDLFETVLARHPNKFEALIGVVFAYLCRLEQIDDCGSMVIGFYHLRKDAQKWVMEQDSVDATNRCIGYLDRAIENAPADMLDRLCLFRKCHVCDSRVLVDKMLRGDPE